MLECVIGKTVFFAVTNIEDKIVVVYSRQITSSVTTVYNVYLTYQEYLSLMKGDLNEVLQRLQESSSGSDGATNSVIHFGKYMPRRTSAAIIQSINGQSNIYQACSLFGPEPVV